MKQIPLTKNKYALVDDEDYDYLMQWKWQCSAEEYAVRTAYGGMGIKRKGIWMHREIMNSPTDKQVDHINGNKLDNRRKNLRLCSKKENSMNRKISSNNTSGYKGVVWSRSHKKWCAQIMSGEKQNFIGLYDNLVEAALAYNEAAKKYHGEFARLNIIPVDTTI